MWRVWNSVAKGFRYNAASARNGTLIPEEEREVSVTLWSKHDGLKCYPPQYHTEGKNTNKEVPSVKWENCVDHAPFLEIVGLSSALALGWQVSHFNWSNKNRPVPLEKRCSFPILANIASAQPIQPTTKLNVLGKTHLLSKTTENLSKNCVATEETVKSDNVTSDKSLPDKAEPEQIMNHIELNIKNDHKTRKAELLNEAGVQLLSAHQKGETSLFEHWIPDARKDRKMSYVHQGFLCFQESRELGSEKGAFNLGLCYEQGFGTCISLEKAAECYEEAAKLGHSGAQYNLGLLHYQGKLKESDQAKGIRFIRLAAKQGLDQAWSTLLIILQSASESSSRNMTSTRSVAEDISKGLLKSTSSHFRKSHSEPHCLFSDPTDNFEKPLVSNQDVSTTFYVGTN